MEIVDFWRKKKTTSLFWVGDGLWFSNIPRSRVDFCEFFQEGLLGMWHGNYPNLWEWRVNGLMIVDVDSECPKRCRMKWTSAADVVEQHPFLVMSEIISEFSNLHQWFCNEYSCASWHFWACSTYIVKSTELSFPILFAKKKNRFGFFPHSEWMSCNIDAGRHQKKKGHITNGTIQLGSGSRIILIHSSPRSAKSHRRCFRGSQVLAWNS